MRNKQVTSATMKLLAAALTCVLLAQIVHGGFLTWGLDGYRDAQSNYHEMLTNCEREGGECIDINFFTGTVGGARGAEENGAFRGGRSGRPGLALHPIAIQEMYNYLYTECRGWEFDPGCYRKGNICCY